MEWLKAFSSDYANAVTALVAVGAFTLAWRTLLYLKREYRAKYRPYLVPVVTVSSFEPEPGRTEFHLFIQPVNVGPHPCHVRLTSILLTIGDDKFPSQDQEHWHLIGGTANYTFEAGHINQFGVQQIRDARYSQNRVELSFNLHMQSTDGEHSSIQKCLYVVEVRGPMPTVAYRPDLLRK